MHGGIASLEETAWQLARFDNVYVNLETTATLATTRPLAFAHALASLIRGPKTLRQILWGTGCMVSHPRPHLENFVRNFRFSDQLVDEGRVPQITMEDKQAILSGNYARLHGLDVGTRLAQNKGDEFDRRRGGADAAPPAPYSTTAIAAVVH